MMDSEALQRPPVPAGMLARPEYAVGRYLAAQDLESEQGYRWERLRRHNRYQHGWGVLCGLGVVPANDPGRPWAVQVCPGLAVGCCGDEIEVPAGAVVDVSEYVWQQPLDSIQEGALAYVGIRYAEEPARPILTAAPVCGCADPDYQPSRVRDSFQVDILWSLPPSLSRAGGDRFDLCLHPSAPCLSCADSQYVILARITLPASEDDWISDAHINNWLHQ
jgi:hypothetical protein